MVKQALDSVILIGKVLNLIRRKYNESLTMNTDTLIELKDVTKHDANELAVAEFKIMAGEHWAVIGGNGSGKSMFARMLSGEKNLRCDQRVTPFEKVLSVSFEKEQGLLEREIYEDDSEYLNKVDQGRTTYELISEHLVDGVDLNSIIDNMQLGAFLHSGFHILSTGERRRLMIARALSQAPQMLVLDEPYDGLDHAFADHLKGVIAELSLQISVVIIVNRMSHLSDHISHLACLHQMELVLAGKRCEIESSGLWRQLHVMDSIQRPLPAAMPAEEDVVVNSDEPLIEMRSVDVGYQSKQVISDLNWRVMSNEHWKVSGPNGCGKSTLLGLISGDHPQCFRNEIYIFGNLRGQGESIWDIKRNMGLMSTALHQQYRVHVTCEVVLLSGFFDTIGIYSEVTMAQRQIAAEWLEFLSLDVTPKTLFKSLSFGQQRMLLIARALIKRPRLLLLDEPCQGLDPINRALIMQLIAQITERELAQIIYISHDAEDHLPCLTHELQFVPSDVCGDDAIPAFSITERILK